MTVRFIYGQSYMGCIEIYSSENICCIEKKRSADTGKPSEVPTREKGHRQRRPESPAAALAMQGGDGSACCCLARGHPRPANSLHVYISCRHQPIYWQIWPLTRWIVKETIRRRISTARGQAQTPMEKMLALLACCLLACCAPAR
jgi:hypothetical protein